jgi:hypothetical protein
LPLLRIAARRETNCTNTPIARHAVEDRRIAPLATIATDRVPRPLGAAAAPHEGVEFPRGEGVAEDADLELDEVDDEREVDVANVHRSLTLSAPAALRQRARVTQGPVPPRPEASAAVLGKERR